MCGGTSVWSKVAFAVMVVALILDIIAIATISWATYEITTNRNRIGLFKMETCVGYTCTTGDVSDDLKDGNFTSAKVMEIFLLILIILAVIVTLIYLIIAALRHNCMAWVAISLCFGACLFGFIGMILWLGFVESPYIIGYSFGLSILASILMLIAGFLLFPDVIDRAREPDWGRY